MSAFDVLGIECDYCARRLKVERGIRLTRERLVRRAREKVGLSEYELGEQLGFESEAIRDMEQDAQFLENWPIVHISNLAAALDVPIQDLLAVTCETCKN
jgi:ribosome-binding protein aMBF1 (putative translation factor)